MARDPESSGSVAQCWRYPVKSLQGARVDRLEVGSSGVVGDRAWALLDRSSGRVMSAKRYSALLLAAATPESIRLPDGVEVRIDDPEVHGVLSTWLGRDVELVGAEGTSDLAYEMTFDPPDDDAEYYDIPIPAGTFVDLAPLHVVAAATLEACRRERPDLDWDVRRFRPNLLLDLGDGPFVEDAWVGRRLRVGEQLVCRVAQPTVRCAMPLRAQPALAGAGQLARQPELFAAMNDLHPAMPNHLGVYVDVEEPGTVRVGDAVQLLDEPR